MGSVIKNGVYANISRWYNLLADDKRFEGSVELMTKSLAEVRKAAKSAKTAAGGVRSPQGQFRN